MEAHLDDVAQGHLRGDGEAVADLLGAVGEGGGVGEEDEGLHPGGLGAVEELLAQLILGGVVELEPEAAPGDLGDLLDGGGAHGTEDEREVVVLGGLGEELAGPRPHQALEADGGHAEGGIVGLAEELCLLVGTLEVAEVAGLEEHVADVGCVARDVDVGEASCREVVEGKARHAAAGAGSEVLDGGEIGVKVVVHGGDPATGLRPPP